MLLLPYVTSHAMAWKLVTGLSLWKSRIHSLPVHLKLIADKVVLQQSFLPSTSSFFCHYITTDVIESQRLRSSWDRALFLLLFSSQRQFIELRSVRLFSIAWYLGNSRVRVCSVLILFRLFRQIYGEQNYPYTYTYIHIDTYIHTHIHTYIHTHIDTYIHIYIYTQIHTQIQTQIHTYIHTQTYIHIHTYTHRYIDTYIHTYIHT